MKIIIWRLSSLLTLRDLVLLVKIGNLHSTIKGSKCKRIRWIYTQTKGLFQSAKKSQKEVEVLAMFKTLQSPRIPL